MSTKRLIRGLADNKTTVLMSMVALFAIAAAIAFGLWPALVEARETDGLRPEVHPGEPDAGVPALREGIHGLPQVEFCGAVREAPDGDS